MSLYGMISRGGPALGAFFDGGSDRVDRAADTSWQPAVSAALSCFSGP